MVWSNIFGSFVFGTDSKCVYATSMPAFLYFVVLAVSVAGAEEVEIKAHGVLGNIKGKIKAGADSVLKNVGGKIKGGGEKIKGKIKEKIKGGAESVLEKLAKKINGGGDHEEGKDDKEGKFAHLMVCECMDNAI